MRFVRVRIPGVGEWSQPAEKPLREDVGEVLVEASEHVTPYRDYPEPADVNRPLDVAAAAEPPETPVAGRRAGLKTPKGA